MNKQLLSVIEAIYLLYMFLVFKTTISLNHPLEMIFSQKLNKLKNTNEFTHSIGNNKIYESKICPFGRKAILLLIGFLLYRSYNTKISKKINLTIMIITTVISLLNLNAFIYLLPYIIIEINYFI